MMRAVRKNVDADVMALNMTYQQKPTESLSGQPSGYPVGSSI